MKISLTKKERFAGCIIGGAIGDAWGSAYENMILENNPTTFYWSTIAEPPKHWAITDDTQLTLATCDAIATSQSLTPETLSAIFLQYYKKRKLTGLGASTLKALRDLEAGAHWSQAGRNGEFAAGNGAAMRIAPLAFIDYISNENIREYCRITHRNDEAFVGALAVVIAIREILYNRWTESPLLQLIIPQLPDTNVRDRLIELSTLGEQVTIAEAAKLGTNGYVVNSIPFALFAASKIKHFTMDAILQQVIDAGGDTDTNASIAGQIIGSFVGIKQMPSTLLEKLMALKDYGWIKTTIETTSAALWKTV